MSQINVLIVKEQTGLDRVLSGISADGEEGRLNIRRCEDAEELRSALEELHAIASATSRFAVKTAGGVKLLQIKDIVFSHMQGHQVVFLLADGEQVYSTTMRVPFHQVVGPLLACGFVQVRRGAIVNPTYMESFSGGELLLKGGEQITVPRRMRAALSTELLTSNRRPPKTGGRQ